MEAYTFLPLYNVEVDESIINQDFNGFRIITSDIFTSEYEKNININNIVSNDFLNELKRDIRKPNKGELYTRELAKYILFKKSNYCQPESAQDEDEVYISRQDIVNIKLELDNFMLSTRLFKEGWIQVYKGYFFSPVYYSCFQLQSSTSIDHIKPSFYTEKPLPKQYYKFDETSFKKIVENIALLKILNDKKITVPIIYFFHYYSATNLFDRIIKLAIILESTMLANCREELKHKLRIRTCAFLQKDLDNILSIFYDMRSAIVHNGDIGTSLYKKIRNTLKYPYETDVEVLFYFIQKEIEPVVREVLYKSLNIFNSSETIKNYSQLADEIDKNIMTKITI